MDEAPRVLIVEDDPGVLKLMVGVLRSAGFDAQGASSCSEAEALVDGQGIPDLLISDLVLPDRGGHELAGRLREVRPELPVLFCSGYDEERLNEATGNATWSSLLVKPFAPRELVERVCAMLAVIS